MEHLDHPSPHFNDGKMARFRTFAPSSLLWGGRGLIFPFYSVQDCGSAQMKTAGGEAALFKFTSCFTPGLLELIPFSACSKFALSYLCTAGNIS